MSGVSNREQLGGDSPENELSPELTVAETDRFGEGKLPADMRAALLRLLQAYLIGEKTEFPLGAEDAAERLYVPASLNEGDILFSNFTDSQQFLLLCIRGMIEGAASVSDQDGPFDEAAVMQDAKAAAEYLARMDEAKWQRAVADLAARYAGKYTTGELWDGSRPPYSQN